MEKEKARLEWIDLLRVIAICCAVLCHATEGVYPLNYDMMAGVELPSRIFIFTAFTFGRMGVPLFLMISGYLLLDREYPREAIQKFWKRNWLHLTICTEIWFILYGVFLSFFLRKAFDPLRMLREILFISKIDLSHVWYMPMIIGLYLLIPFAARALKGIETRMLRWPFLFFAAYAFGFPLIQLLNNNLGGASLSLQMSLGFSGGTYGLYLLAGYLIRKGCMKKIPAWVLRTVGIASAAAGIALQILLYTYRSGYNIWYDSPFLLISGACIFELVSRKQKIPCRRVVFFISRYSFGIYLIHNMFRLPLKEPLGSIGLRKPFQVGVLWILCMGLSLLAAWAISRIPRVGNYLLYIRENKTAEGRKAIQKKEKPALKEAKPAPKEKKEMLQQPESKGMDRNRPSGIRIEWMDALKGICIILVVFCHQVTINRESIAGNFLMALAWSAVPCFLMTTGALMHRKTEFSPRKHGGRIGKAYLVLCFWRFAYFLIQKGIFGFSIGWRNLAGYFFLFQNLDQVNSGPLWYMEAHLMMLIIYPITWALWHRSRKTGSKAFIYMMILAGTAGILLPSLIWTKGKAVALFGIPDFDMSRISVILPFGNYANCLFYFLLGILLTEYAEKIRQLIGKGKFLFPAGILVFTLLLMTVKRLDTGTFTWNSQYLTGGYTRVCTAGLSVSLFLTFMLYAEPWKKLNAILGKAIGRHTMGIYYTHSPALLLLRQYVLPALGWPSSLLLNCLKTAVTVVICTGITVLAKKVRFLQKLFQ